MVEDHCYGAVIHEIQVDKTALGFGAASRFSPDQGVAVLSDIADHNQGVAPQFHTCQLVIAALGLGLIAHNCTVAGTRSTSY